MNESYLSIHLPSKCLSYEGIKPEDITIRAYQGKDAVYLAEITPINLSQKFLTVLGSVVKGIDPELLTLGDRLYIMIWECAKSYTEIIKVSTTCTHCLKDISVDVDLGKLNVITLPDNFKQPYKVTLPSGKVVNLRLLTVADEIAMEKFEEKNEDGLLFRQARSIVDDRDILARLEELRNMDARDIATIEAFHEKFYHGPDLVTSFKCPECKKEDELDVPFRFDFFFPYGRALTDNFGKGI